MGRLNLRMPDKLEEQFRATATLKFGNKRGSLRKAFIEAAKTWIEKVEEEMAIKKAIKSE